MLGSERLCSELCFCGRCETSRRSVMRIATSRSKSRARHIRSWPGANNAPIKAEYICADPPGGLRFRLQKCSGPYIYSATDRHSSAASSSIFTRPRTVTRAPARPLKSKVAASNGHQSRGPRGRDEGHPTSLCKTGVVIAFTGVGFLATPLCLLGLPTRLFSFILHPRTRLKSK
jgi:hypothetical protein